MIKYKLLDQNMTSYGGCKWKIGEWKEATGLPILPLCTKGWLHCYDDPLLALLHNPIHAVIRNPRLFEVEVDGTIKDDYGLKCGYRRMRLVQEIKVPDITWEQRVRYAIFCAMKVCNERSFLNWAEKWLSGEDRSKEAALSAQQKVRSLSTSHYALTFEFAIDAAKHAACAAKPAAKHATYIAACAAECAAYAAAYAAVNSIAKLNLSAIAKRAMKND